MEEVWGLVIPGIWKERVSSPCHELSLHCHCLNNDFKAPVSLADDRLSCGKARGSAGRVPVLWGRGCLLPLTSFQLPGEGLAARDTGRVWELLCVPGSQPCQELAAVNTPSLSHLCGTLSLSCRSGGGGAARAGTFYKVWC